MTELIGRPNRAQDIAVPGGAEAEPVLVDRATGRRVDGPDFIFTAGPAASRPFQDRYATRPEPRQP